jgi:hypothetical protein
MDMEAVEVENVGWVGRFLAAQVAKFGIPIPTTVSPDVLGKAKDLAAAESTAQTTGGGRVEGDGCRTMPAGVVVEGKLAITSAEFFTLDVRPLFFFSFFPTCSSLSLASFLLRYLPCLWPLAMHISSTKFCFVLFLSSSFLVAYDHNGMQITAEMALNGVVIAAKTKRKNDRFRVLVFDSRGDVRYQVSNYSFLLQRITKSLHGKIGGRIFYFGLI